jgi:hypothetical protein
MKNLKIWDVFYDNISRCSTTPPETRQRFLKEGNVNSNIKQNKPRGYQSATEADWAIVAGRQISGKFGG